MSEQTYEQRVSYIAGLASYLIEDAGYSYHEDGTVDLDTMHARKLERAAQLWEMDDTQLAAVEKAVIANWLRHSPLRPMLPTKRFHVEVKK